MIYPNSNPDPDDWLAQQMEQWREEERRILQAYRRETRRDLIVLVVISCVCAAAWIAVEVLDRLGYFGS